MSTEVRCLRCPLKGLGWGSRGPKLDPNWWQKGQSLVRGRGTWPGMGPGQWQPSWRGGCLENRWVELEGQAEDSDLSLFSLEGRDIVEAEFGVLGDVALGPCWDVGVRELLGLTRWVEDEWKLNACDAPCLGEHWSVAVKLGGCTPNQTFSGEERGSKNGVLRKFIHLLYFSSWEIFISNGSNIGSRWRSSPSLLQCWGDRDLYGEWWWIENSITFYGVLHALRSTDPRQVCLASQFPHL
jgi:hypothetical protein